jgi:hypothetical protein
MWKQRRLRPRFPLRRPLETLMTEPLDEARALQLVETAQQMVHVWERLSAERQASLLERFGTRETALAALVATKIIGQPTS